LVFKTELTELKFSLFRSKPLALGTEV